MSSKQNKSTNNTTNDRWYHLRSDTNKIGNNNIFNSPFKRSIRMEKKMETPNTRVKYEIKKIYPNAPIKMEHKTISNIKSFDDPNSRILDFDNHTPSRHDIKREPPNAPIKSENITPININLSDERVSRVLNLDTNMSSINKQVEKFDQVKQGKQGNSYIDNQVPPNLPNLSVGSVIQTNAGPIIMMMGHNGLVPIPLYPPNFRPPIQSVGPPLYHQQTFYQPPPQELMGISRNVNNFVNPQNCNCEVCVISMNTQTNPFILPKKPISLYSNDPMGKALGLDLEGLTYWKLAFEFPQKPDNIFTCVKK